jgi:serpin B
MTDGVGAALFRRLRRLVGPAEERELTDAVLLRRFARRRDADAFAELVRRHGPMVLGVCRRRLGHAQDAEDAFQAAFLVLARKAGSVRRGASVGGWLHRVACHVAADARAAAARRRVVEEAAPAAAPADSAADEAERKELGPVLDEELRRLPQKYREVVVLCLLEGKTLAAAAAELDWPLGTVAGRLSRARDLLRRRLHRRGLAPAGENVPAAVVPPALADATIRASLNFAAGGAAAGVSAPSAALAKGALRTMSVNSWKAGAVLALLVGAAAAGGFVLWGRPPEKNPKAPGAPPVAGRPADDDAAAADRQTLVRGNNAFALDLYGRLRGRGGDLFFSPYSISSALAMAYAGADGDTAEQMAKTLHFDLPPDRLHPAFAALRRDLAGDEKTRGYDLRSAAGLWRAKRFALRPEFQDRIKADYGAGVVGEVDSFGTDEARRAINSWVEDRTDGKIKELIGPRALRDEARWVLVDAVAFRGAWALPFPKELTYKAPFRVSDEETVQASYMHLSADVFLYHVEGDDAVKDAGLEDGFRYLDGGSFKAVELPYAGKALSMVVFLPKQADGLDQFEEGLTADKLDGWMAAMKPRPVHVSLPRFRFDCEASLQPELTALGMGRAFDPEKANFSRLGPDRSWLDAAVHKAAVEVNEKGTEGAAATGLIGVGGKDEAARFTADHPFVFLIRDTRSGAVLFLGRVLSPRE